MIDFSLLMFSFLPLIFSSPLQDIHLWTHRDIKIMFLRGDQQIDLGLSSPCFGSNRNCTPLIVYKNVLWTRWGTLTWFLPTTDAPALMIYVTVFWIYTFFIQLFHVPDTSTVAHQKSQLCCHLQRRCHCLNSLKRKCTIFNLRCRLSFFFLVIEIIHA